MEPDGSAQVAVFVDFENLVLGAVKELPGQANPAPYEALTRLCRGYGNASVRRAYADWANPRFGGHQEDLAMNGVDLIQVARVGIQNKNAADIRMAVDAMETLIVHPEVSVFVLVSGEGRDVTGDPRYARPASGYFFTATVALLFCALPALVVLAAAAAPLVCAGAAACAPAAAPAGPTARPSACRRSTVCPPMPLTRLPRSAGSLNGPCAERSSRMAFALAGPMPLMPRSASSLAVLTSTAA